MPASKLSLPAMLHFSIISDILIVQVLSLKNIYFISSSFLQSSIFASLSDAEFSKVTRDRI